MPDHPARPFRPRATPRARSLRREAPPAERLLWRRLSGGKAGAKFSRQMPLGPWFADFLCRELGLMIELDGASHEARQAHDAARDRWMREAGYRVLRFTNAEVYANTEGVLAAIVLAISERRGGEEERAHPQPLPPAGGE